MVAGTGPRLRPQDNPAGGLQHLRIGNDPLVGAGTFTGAFSPNLGALPVGPSSVSMDIAISNTGGADYDVIPQAPSQGFLTARVKFSSPPLAVP